VLFLRAARGVLETQQQAETKLAGRKPGQFHPNSGV